MRENSHVRLGGRRRANHPPKGRHRRLAADPARLSARSTLLPSLRLREPRRRMNENFRIGPRAARLEPSNHNKSPLLDIQATVDQIGQQR
jgi:hypothetical protein